MSQSIWSAGSQASAQSGLFDLLSGLGNSPDVADENAAAMTSPQEVDTDFLEALSAALNELPQNKETTMGEDLTSLQSISDESSESTDSNSFPIALLNGLQNQQTALVPKFAVPKQKTSIDNSQTEVLYSSSPKNKSFISQNLLNPEVIQPQELKNLNQYNSNSAQLDVSKLAFANALKSSENQPKTTKIDNNENENLQKISDLSTLFKTNKQLNFQDEFSKREILGKTSTQNSIKELPQQSLLSLMNSDSNSHFNENLKTIEAISPGAVVEFSEIPETDQYTDSNLNYNAPSEKIDSNLLREKLLANLTQKDVKTLANDNTQKVTINQENLIKPTESVQSVVTAPNTFATIVQNRSPNLTQSQTKVIKSSEDGNNMTIESSSESFYTSTPSRLEQIKDDANEKSENESKSDSTPFGHSQIENRESKDNSKMWIGELGKRDNNLENISPLAKGALERTRDMAAQLQSRGGVAKIQINDAKMGSLKLEIRVQQGNKVFVEVHSASKGLKDELRDNMEALKQSLEERHMSLSEFKFTVDNTASQAQASANTNTQHQSNSQHHQDQTQQQFQSSQQSEGFHRQNFNGQNSGQDAPAERFFGDSLQQSALSKNFARSAAANMERQTNIQRSANGSLKVRA